MLTHIQAHTHSSVWNCLSLQANSSPVRLDVSLRPESACFYYQVSFDALVCSLILSYLPPKHTHTNWQGKKINTSLTPKVAKPTGNCNKLTNSHTEFHFFYFVCTHRHHVPLADKRSGWCWKILLVAWQSWTESQNKGPKRGSKGSRSKHKFDRHGV